MKYISKSALVAEIEKTYNFHEKRGNIHDASICDVLYGLLHRINTLEVKESLTWQDIRLISEIGEKFMNSEESDNLSEEEYYTEIFNRFKAQKHETDII